MIDTAALQSKIIDLAIQGKLTEQLPTDGSAEELYQQIQAEKAKLIKDKKIKKEKPLSEITADEIPFDVPDNWKWVRIGDVVKYSLGGGTPSKNISEYWNGGDIPWASVKDFSAAEAGCLNDTIDHITQDGLNNSASNMVDENAIVICMRMALGKAVRFLRPMAINQDLRAIWLHDCVDQSYFMYMYSTIKVEGRGTTVVGIRKDELMSFLFPLPPLSEQKRIVAKIDEVLTEIKIIDELQTQYASNVDALKSKIIDAGIRGQLTEQLPEDSTAEELYQQIQAEKAQLIKDKKIKKEKPLPEITADEIPFDVPDNWKWVRWGDISQSIQYGYNAPALENGRIKMVRISDIQSNEVLWEDVPYCDIDEDSIETYLLQPNDILFARTGGTVGKSYLVEEVPEKAVYAGYLIRTQYSSLLSPRYLKYFMQGSLYWSQLRNGTIATAQPNCNGKTLGKMIVPLPPLSEQKRIVAKINDVFGALDERDRL